MGYLKIVAYLYLVAAAFLVYEGIASLNAGDSSNGIVMFLLALVALFMFFFRLRYAKKWADRKKDN
jgi:divalent metal cation (Fe/Co/Zn/Cd) transporter